MCGIVGKFNYKSREKVDISLVHRMCSKIEHRGPDDEGYYVQGVIGLGMRRLSIIDVAGGKQPISNEEKNIFVVSNGEIYNFLELRKKLERLGHIFATNSDTEVIVHLYEGMGIDFVTELRGMFGIAIWDERSEKLILARDRMGKKPLYYTVTEKALIFGSEIKAILEDPCVDRKVNLKALDGYLTYQYVPGTKTMFEGVNKIPPASRMIVEKNNVRVDKYWELDNRCNESIDENEIVERLGSLLEESVKIRMVSDVPLGAFLSGGLDSSLIVGLMAKISNAPVKTFSIGFDEKELDESAYANIVAKHFKTDHHVHYVQEGVRDIVEKLVWHYDQPFGDASSVPTYLVSKVTRQTVTVALTGDGADELFTGYWKYRILSDKLKEAKYLRGVKSAIYECLKRVPLNPLMEPRHLHDIFLSALARVMPPIERDLLYMTLFDRRFRNLLYSREVKDKLNHIGDAEEFYFSQLRSSPNQSLISKVNYFDLTSYLPDCMLVKVDVASMANSLEIRNPFLDHKLVEFVVALPDEFKLNGGIGKYILRKMARNLLPEIIIERPKMGFAPPVDLWFRRELKDLACECLINNPISRMFFNEKITRQIVLQHLTGRHDRGRLIWLLVNFVIWYRTFMENR